jgi:uncharacterized protein with PIN domain
VRLSTPALRTVMSGPRWLVDEMLGRLARYLRFLGHDTEYVRGLEDSEIRRRVRAEGRILLTRDRLLSTQTPSAVWIPSVELPEQLRILRDRFPALPFEVRFDRCTVCNGELALVPVTESSPERGAGRTSLPRAGAPIYACTRCGHRYWEGSHTSRIRSVVAAALRGVDPA